jgi:hypothetical protein
MYRSLISGVLLIAIAASKTVPASGDAQACDVTKPNGVVEGVASSFGNSQLAVGPFGLWPDGNVVFKPGGPGSIYPDGSLGMKFGWSLGASGQLRVEGRRLDGTAPPLRAHYAGITTDGSFQPTELIFSTPGCWEVTGHLGEASLTFVTMVTRISGLERKPS